MEKSENFPIKFGIDTCRVKSQPIERHPDIQKQILSAYPVIHERVLALYLAFLEHKCKYGNEIELQLYKGLTLTEFVQRLLEKRCAAFYGPEDKYYLLSGETGSGGFTEVGTTAEVQPLVLQNVLSYDEMKLSAFLSISSHSEFINNGNRYNFGCIATDKSKIETNGVIIGLTGGRFQKPGLMEWQDIVITKTQNTTENGYGLSDTDIPHGKAQSYRHIWRQFYEEKDFLYTDDYAEPRCIYLKAMVHPLSFFDNLLMKKRYSISFDTLLLESEARAAAAGKSALIHLIDFGLAHWKIRKNQEGIFFCTFIQRLKALVPILPNVDIVYFAEFNSKWRLKKDWVTFDRFIECKTHPKGGILTYWSNRHPADKLKQDMLLIISYARDSYALPGNEFWLKYLDWSSDSAAACSSLITELHNPHINSAMINGSNLHIASEKYGVVHISDYAKRQF